MGGSSGSNGQSTLEVFGRDNAEQINCMDDFTRQAQEQFLAENPQIIDPKCKAVDFRQELWKHVSTLQELCQEMHNFVSRVRSQICVVSSVLPETTDELEQQPTEKWFSEYLQLASMLTGFEQTKRKFNLLQQARKRCEKMARRVLLEVKQLHAPEADLSYKKTLNPELTEEEVNGFIAQCAKMVDIAENYIREFSELAVMTQQIRSKFM